MKFLILGAGGMAGHTIFLYLKERGHVVNGLSRSAVQGFETISGDALDTVFIKQLITEKRYDYIVNCVGILNKAADENPAQAVLTNSYIPHLLALMTADTNTRVIHLSTDCVFSGQRGNYTENDIKDGATFYDRTKALGELDDEKNLTLRNSIVGPDLKATGIGLLNWFLQQHDTVVGFRKAIWTGQTTLQLAKTIEAAAQERATGLYNMVPNTAISKYDLLQLFNQAFRNGSLRIEPSDEVVVDKSLKRTRFDFSYSIPNYEQMISDLADWMYAHKTLYPHYRL